MQERTSKQNQLLDAGLDVFYEKGFDRATIDDIVGRADCGKGTFYRYFESKDALFNALENRFRELLLAELEKHCPYSLSVADFFSASLKTFIKVFTTHQRLGLVKFTRDQQTGTNTNSCREENLPSIAYLHKYIARAIDKGEIRKLKIDAIIGTMIGAVHFYLFRSFKLGKSLSDGELEDTVDIMLNGVIPS